MITSRDFGALPTGERVSAFDLTSEAGFRATILSYGATLQSLTFPDNTDVVLGFDTLEEYLSKHPYFGAIIGRVSNRISGGAFKIDGIQYQLPKNENENNLHSGPIGFDRVNWDGAIENDTLILRHISPDGHQGFPGKLTTELRFKLSGNTLSLEMIAKTDKATPINLAYHPYFNLTDGGATPCTDHVLEVKAHYYLPKNQDNLPTGSIKRCACSANDFRQARTVDDSWAKNLDHMFIRTKNGEAGMFKMAKLWSKTTCHKIIICSTQPCLQAYTGQYIPNLRGKSGTAYGPNHGIALEPQGFVDSLNHEKFPDEILRPGDIYKHKISYSFRPGEAQV